MGVINLHFFPFLVFTNPTNYMAVLSCKSTEKKAIHVPRSRES